MPTSAELAQLKEAGHNAMRDAIPEIMKVIDEAKSLRLKKLIVKCAEVNDTDPSQHNIEKINLIGKVAKKYAAVEAKKAANAQLSVIEALKEYAQEVADMAVKNLANYRKQVDKAPIPEVLTREQRVSKKMQLIFVVRECKNVLDEALLKLDNAIEKLKSVDVNNKPKYDQAMDRYKNIIYAIYQLRRVMVENQIRLMPRGGLYQLHCQEEFSFSRNLDLSDEWQKPASDFLKERNETLSIISQAAVDNEDPIIKNGKRHEDSDNSYEDNHRQGPSERQNRF